MGSTNRLLLIACVALALLTAVVFGAARLRNARPPQTITPQIQAAAASAAALSRARQDVAAFERQAAPSAGPAASDAHTRAAFAELQRSTDRWADVYRVALASPRVGLGSHVTTLQDIRRELAAAVVPPCAESGKTGAAAAMADTIDLFLLFLADAKLGRQVFESGSAAAEEKLKSALESIRSCRVLMLGAG